VSFDRDSQDAAIFISRQSPIPNSSPEAPFLGHGCESGFPGMKEDVFGYEV